ncbi:MAG: ABC transporter permease [Pseudoclavibacter sp.]
MLNTADGDRAAVAAPDERGAMRALIVKEFRELRRDRRTLAMVVGLPLLLLIIFGYAANFTVATLDTAVVGSGAAQTVDRIDAIPQAKDHLHVVVTDGSLSGTAARTRAAHLLRDGRAAVAIVPDGDRLRVDIDGSNLFAAQSAKILFSQLASQAAAQAQTASQAQSQTPAAAVPATGRPQAVPQLTVRVLFNPDLKTSWVMIPAIIGLILAFVGMIVTSIGLVRERETGTLEQLAVMPLRPGAVVMGKIVPYLLLASFDMAVVTLLGMWIFGVPFRGSVLLFAAGALLFLFTVLGLGVLISSVSQTTGQAVQMAVMFLLPQILLSGMIFPLDAMAAGVRWIGYLLPLTWFVKISQGVMVRGAGWGPLWFPLAVLAFMAVVAFGAAVLRLASSLRPVGARR